MGVWVRWAGCEKRAEPSIPIDKERVLLTVAAASILRNGENGRPRLSSAKDRLESLAGVRGTEGLSDVVIERMVKMRAEVIDNIVHGMRFLRLCQRFFTKDNMKALSRLAIETDTPAEKIALHKVPEGGWELIITSYLYAFHSDSSVEGRSTRYRLPSFDNLPPDEALLARLRGR